MRVKMPKSYMRWRLDPQHIPLDPEKRAKLWLKMLDMVKADMKSGAITGWGICYDASAGYAFSDLSPQELYTVMLKWMPYVDFDVKPVLDVDQVIESIKKAAAAA